MTVCFGGKLLNVLSEKILVVQLEYQEPQAMAFDFLLFSFTINRKEYRQEVVILDTASITFGKEVFYSLDQLFKILKFQSLDLANDYLL